MELGECPSCERAGHTVGDGWPHGINCGCGHHFHIGDFRLTGGVVLCPRCEGGCHPVEIGRGTSTEGEQE